MFFICVSDHSTLCYCIKYNKHITISSKVMIWLMPASLQRSADEVGFVICVLKMGKSMQRETGLPQQACGCARSRGEVHVLTPKYSHRSFKMAAQNILFFKCEANGNGSFSGCACLSNMLIFFPNTH